MNNNYMVAESTLLTGHNFSFQATKDIQNGAIVGKGDLMTGEDSVYVALDDYSNGKYLVLNPAWSYDDSRISNQNEENFVNKTGIAFRVYSLEKDNKFKIYNIEEEFEIGDCVKYDPASEKYVVDTNSDLKVVDIENVGFPYCIGSIGVKVIGDDDNKYGYATGNRTIKYTIEKFK